MTDGAEIPETIVFDAEPLIAYFCNEPGSDTVETYVDAAEGTADGYISAINLAEVHYIVRAIDGEERADAVVDVLEESGIRRVDTEQTWRQRPTSNSAIAGAWRCLRARDCSIRRRDAPRRGR